MLNCFTHVLLLVRGAGDRLHARHGDAVPSEPGADKVSTGRPYSQSDADEDRIVPGNWNRRSEVTEDDQLQGEVMTLTFVFENQLQLLQDEGLVRQLGEFHFQFGTALQKLCVGLLRRLGGRVDMGVVHQLEEGGG